MRRGRGGQRARERERYNKLYQFPFLALGDLEICLSVCLASSPFSLHVPRACTPSSTPITAKEAHFSEVFQPC